MTPEIEELPFDQLRTLHREIGALIAERKHQELEQIKERILLLGFTPLDLAPAKHRKGNGAAKYRDPDTGESHSGKGKHPQWLKDKLEAGHTLDDFRAA